VPFTPRKTIFTVLFEAISDRTDARTTANRKTNKGEKIGNREATVRAVTNAPAFDLQVQKTWPSFRAARGAGRPRFHPPAFSLFSPFSALPSFASPSYKPLRLPFAHFLPILFTLYLSCHNLETPMQRYILCKGMNSSDWHFGSREKTIAFRWYRRNKI